MRCFNREDSLVIILDFHDASKNILGYRMECLLGAGLVSLEVLRQRIFFGEELKRKSPTY